MTDLIIEFLPVYAICGAFCWWGWRGLHTPERD